MTQQSPPGYTAWRSTSKEDKHKKDLRVVFVIVKNRESLKGPLEVEGMNRVWCTMSGRLCSLQNGQARATRISVGMLTNTMWRKKSKMVPFPRRFKNKPPNPVNDVWISLYIFKSINRPIRMIKV